MANTSSKNQQKSKNTIVRRSHRVIKKPARYPSKNPYSVHNMVLRSHTK